VTSPKPLPAPAATAVWGGVAVLVAVSAARYVLITGPSVQARLDRLADEQRDQDRQERQLFWRTVAITALVAMIVTARLVVG
jgi:hypothetical protein